MHSRGVGTTYIRYVHVYNHCMSTSHSSVIQMHVLLGSLVYILLLFSQPGSDTMHMHVQMICAGEELVRVYT